MTQISYLNGAFVPHNQAMIHIDDRGLQFSDAVYEVVAFFNGKPLDMDSHLNRLDRSMGELSIKFPGEGPNFKRIIDELISQNKITCGIIYIQITRGVAPRNHVFPPSNTQPTVIATARPFDLETISERLKTGVSVTLTPENRWARPDIKSTSLLGNILAKEEAKRAGAYEAWFVDEAGLITEGTASNAVIISEDRKLITRKPDGAILSGITRAALLGVAKGVITGIEERGFSREELGKAKEAFLTSTTSFVMPVIKAGDNIIGNGCPGSVTKALQLAYFSHIKKQTGFEGFK